jgi:hypothetical protein
MFPECCQLDAAVAELAEVKRAAVRGVSGSAERLELERDIREKVEDELAETRCQLSELTRLLRREKEERVKLSNKSGEAKEKEREREKEKEPQEFGWAREAIREAAREV